MVINGCVENVIHIVSHKYLDVHGVVLHALHQSQQPNKMKRNKTKGMSKAKNLTSVPVLIRRLFKLASQLCRERANFKCEICGMKKGDIHPNTGKPQRVEAHHIMSRSNKDSVLKFKLQNLICLCTSCHKTNQFSAHKHSVWFAEWLRINKPEQHAWVLKHSKDTANLKDRDILKGIEDCLKSGKPLNFTKINKEYTQLEFDIYCG